MQSIWTFKKPSVLPFLARPYVSQTSRATLESWMRRYGSNSSSYVLLEGPKGENVGRELPASRSERALKRQVTTAFNNTEPQTVVLALN